jgi:chitinase
VFSTEGGREAFTASVKRLCDRTGIDGIDLDWEYPAIEGYPGHPYSAADRDHFTDLLRKLRKTLGSKAEISFAAGGFKDFVNTSVDWKAVEPLIDRVNLMTYDLVTEGAPITGHHTGLYSTSMQERSSQSALDLLRAIGFPMNKVALGCAFYARSFDQVPDKNNGLYQTGKFKAFIPYRELVKLQASDNNIKAFRDIDAHAPYLYNAVTHTYYTFDDKTSITEKTNYVIDHGLNGIMFWELTLDQREGGLLDAINETIRKNKKSSQ